MQVYTNLSVPYRFWIAFTIGIIVGIIGGIIRLGWEILFPIDFSEKIDDITKHIMEFLHITPEIMTIQYVFTNGYEWRIFYLTWQFGFSIFFGVLYVILAEFYLKLKFAHGILYGAVLWILCYAITLPLFGFIDSSNQTWVYFTTSFLEILLWIWITELIRRDLRNRITQERDPF